MSDLNHQRDFRQALLRIDMLCRNKGHSDGVTIGQIMEVAQAALANADAADKTLSDIQNGHIALQHT